ncbi:MAG: hypothetical protein HY898_35040 [Deltaproteobacteria bacterium]|nr:hypothetical protein [Deltaproteobacteria bacterium]
MPSQLDKADRRRSEARLERVREVAHTPYDEPLIADLQRISDLSPDLVKAEAATDGLTIWGSAGTLRTRYEALALRFDRGTPLAFAALADAARQYWDEWRKHWDKEQKENIR